MDDQRSVTGHSADVQRLVAALGITAERVTSVVVCMMPGDYVTITTTQLASVEQIAALAAQLEAAPLQPHPTMP